MPIIMGNSGNEYEIRKIGGNDKIKKHLSTDIKDFSDTWIQP